MEEPGKDTTKFDSLIPTVVHPVSMDTYYSAAPDKVGGPCFSFILPAVMTVHSYVLLTNFAVCLRHSSSFTVSSRGIVLVARGGSNAEVPLADHPGVM